MYLRYLDRNNILYTNIPTDGNATWATMQSSEFLLKNIIDNPIYNNKEDAPPSSTYPWKQDIEISSQPIENNEFVTELNSGTLMDVVEIKIPVNSNVRKKISEIGKRDSIEIDNLPKWLRTMGRMFRRNFKLECDSAMSFIIDQLQQELESGEYSRSEACNRFYQRRLSIENIRRRNISFNRSKTNNRLNTNLTSLASDLRQFIIGFEDMSYLDLKNSQPVIFNVLLDEHRTERESRRNEEFDLYRQLTMTGKFYDRLGEIYQTDRVGAKDIWMWVAYSRHGQFNEFKRVFKDHFPFVYDVILAYKHDSHANFSIELQKRESEIFIDGICKKLVNEKGVVPYSIHDAVLVPKEHEEAAYTAMCEVLEGILGDTPVIAVNEEPRYPN